MTPEDVLAVAKPDGGQDAKRALFSLGDQRAHFPQPKFLREWASRTLEYCRDDQARARQNRATASGCNPGLMGAEDLRRLRESH
jgi:hypothetical protein